MNRPKLTTREIIRLDCMTLIQWMDKGEWSKIPKLLDIIEESVDRLEKKLSIQLGSEQK